MQRWLWILGGGVVGGLILKFLTDEPEISPDEVPVPPAPSSSELPDFPALEVGPGFYLATTAAQAFIAMRRDAASDGVALPISTAWRSRNYQQWLYDRYQAYLAGGPWAPQAAKPGTSKHEVGLALDLNGIDPGNSNFVVSRRAWLDRNAADYGWTNVGATFKSKEPWHWEWKAPAVA